MLLVGMAVVDVPKEYSCSHLSSEKSRALVGSMPDYKVGVFTSRYVVIGKPQKTESCSDVCPNHVPKEGEVALLLDPELIEQLYHSVVANRARKDAFHKKIHDLRAARYRSRTSH